MGHQETKLPFVILLPLPETRCNRACDSVVRKRVTDGCELQPPSSREGWELWAELLVHCSFPSICKHPMPDSGGGKDTDYGVRRAYL